MAPDVSPVSYWVNVLLVTNIPYAKEIFRASNY